MESTMSFEKFERNGEVAVLYSPGFGAGWSTWNHEYEEALLFDREIVEAVLAENRQLAEEIAERKYPDVYTGGAEDLEVYWVSKGIRFEVSEYDGSERVRVFSPPNGYEA